LFNVVTKSIAMHGFNVFQLSEKYEDEFYETVPARIAKGELKYREDVTVGLEKVGEAILAVQTGKNNGKSVIHVADA
jgi:NADPH-dependent curcumin reductase CurA